MKKQTRRRRTAYIAGIAVLVVATATLARYASSRIGSGEPSGQPPAMQLAETPAPAAPTPVVHRRHQAARPAAEKSKPTAATTARVEAVPATAAAVAPAHAVAAPVTIAPTAAAASSASGQSPITITGCLETAVDEDRFRLTDTEGSDAPKARSWRSGFLTKRPAPVGLADVSDPAGLRKYVGRRVTATGLLTSGELRVRSLRPAGASCN